QLRQLGAGADRPGRLTVHGELTEVFSGAFFVQENAPERLDVKHDLYRRFELHAEADALIASSASGLPWSRLSAQMDRPERLLNAHPYNPPHLVPLVELFCPAEASLARAEDLYRRIGRVPVRMKREAVGHLANRLASALWREAVHIVAEGIADVEAVDLALVNGPGLRWAVMGAHMTYHLGGGAGGMAHYLEHLGDSQEGRWSTLGTPRLTPELRAALIAGVEAEAGGKSIAQLEQERDAALIGILATRKALDT
ncbi:MAG: 3-hydroxyacyl-CoA dehydrogenase, partial [Planktomarina temperata]|nr:3-hydroxyacyl-CoA dehydrogenase [Planktomarina temperata]